MCHILAEGLNAVRKPCCEAPPGPVTGTAPAQAHWLPVIKAHPGLSAEILSSDRHDSRRENNHPSSVSKEAGTREAKWLTCSRPHSWCVPEGESSIPLLDPFHYAKNWLPFSLLLLPGNPTLWDDSSKPETMGIKKTPLGLREASYQLNKLVSKNLYKGQLLQQNQILDICLRKLLYIVWEKKFRYRKLWLLAE